MKQIVHLNDQVKRDVIQFERNCDEIGKKLQTAYSTDFFQLGETLIIELIREKKGKPATLEDLFSDGYESYLEIAVEKNGVYFPNGYIPVWKCRQEMFDKIGKIVNLSIEALEKKLQKMITEIYDDHRRELKEK